VNAGRRQLLLGATALGLLAKAPAWALREDAAPAGPQLDLQQSERFRAWFVRLMEEQVRRPSPRWQHRDCAGLVRFAVDEALGAHDADWRQAMGLRGVSLPPPIGLDAATRDALRQRWHTLDGQISAFVTASALVLANCRPVGRDFAQARPGDLIFYDQGDDQHLMVWMGGWVAYHTGTVTPTDNGLRAVALDHLMNWKDTRWRPLPGNPNFAGLFRLSFLAR